eukprot:scaffold41757_cov60-Phaeocystis_antarctica.AAC.2
MFNLTYSEVLEPHGGRCVWWHRGRACGACRCLDVRVCLGTGVWGEAAASVRRRCARLRNAQNCDQVVYFVEVSGSRECPFACVENIFIPDSPSRPARKGWPRTI